MSDFECKLDGCDNFHGVASPKSEADQIGHRNGYCSGEHWAQDGYPVAEVPFTESEVMQAGRDTSNDDFNATVKRRLGLS